MSLSVSFLALSVFTFSLALHRHAFDFLLPLSSFYRLMGYSLLSFTILYLGVRKGAKAIVESTRKLLHKLMKEKPVNEEGIFYLEIEKVSNFIKDIKKKGFKFAIDDFGSGYASFLYLKYLPVDFLKIEGEFIRSMKRSRVDKTFVKSMVDMDKGLGIKTVAECVEDEETLSLLLDLGKPGHVQEKLKNLFSKGESL